MNFKVEFIENTMLLETSFEENTKELEVSFGEFYKVGVGSEDIPVYDGGYDVTPAVDAQTLPTAQKFLTSNIEVAAIPYAEVTNASGGQTVTIG